MLPDVKKFRENWRKRRLKTYECLGMHTLLKEGIFASGN